MNRLRTRIIAVQAIVVSLLAVIVVLTILRPDEENALRAVDAPQGEPPTAGDGRNPGGDGRPGEDGDDAPGEQGGGGDGATAGTPAAGGSAEAAIGSDTSAEVGSATATATGTPVGEGGGDDGDSPSDDQYADTVTRLMSALYEEQ